MDISVRLYNTSSGLRSPLEDERAGHTDIAIPTEDEREAGTAPFEDEEGTTDEVEAAGVKGKGVRALAPQQRDISSEQIQQAEQVTVEDFEAIFSRYQGPITNFIYHLIGNREQAYDLAQDVFVKAYKALLGGTVVQPGALSAWLYRIAANTTTDTLRRRRLISWLPMSLFNEDRGIGAGVLSDSGGTASDSFSTNGEDGSSDGRSSSIGSLYERGGYDGGRFENRVADREIVERIFKQLPPKYAICLWLYENDGLSCAQIAETLNISASAVKMRLMRARERFINLYQQEVGDQ